MRKKPDDETDLKIVINHPQITTYNDLLGMSFIKQKLCICEKPNINTLRNSAQECMCVWYTQVMPQIGPPVLITFMETMEGIPIANKFQVVDLLMVMFHGLKFYFLLRGRKAKG